MDDNASDAPVHKVALPKCSICYWANICMLTIFMRKKCGGPFKDKTAHVEFVNRHVVTKKTMKYE
jgi:hypothetical protein